MGVGYHDHRGVLEVLMEIDKCLVNNREEGSAGINALESTG